MVQVEIQFTIRHTMDELKNEFIRLGHLPDWETTKARMDDGSSRLFFLETRTIGIDLHNETERYAWFVFSFEACGELKQRIVIPHIVASTINVNDLALDDFLSLCRECLIAPPRRSKSDVSQDITEEHIGLRSLLNKMLD